MNATKQRARNVAKALKPAVDTLLLTMAHAQLTREKIDPVQREALAGFDYRVDLDEREEDYGERITDPRLLYLTRADCAEYFAETHRRYLAMGYDVKPGYCPALIAESAVVDAKHALIEAAGQFFDGITVDKLICAGMDKYEQFIDLTIKLVVNAPGYRNPMAR